MKPRIAIVDTDVELLELMREIMSFRGWETLACPDGSRAYGLISATLPEAIVLDIWLEQPHTGWHLLQQLKSEPETGRIPIVICSAAVDRLREKEAWLGQHGIEIVAKPFDIEELLDRIALALEAGEDSDALGAAGA